uniref:Dynein regulatory complex subunit 2 n=1 Tax=Periophthalmus magnuspinnatus TaxID=409849 RepID=A0A3B3ZS36_9GOBI
MPRGKRSRASKVVRSEEDRPLYLQQRAQAEAELARKKEEILTHFLRDKLQDDERNSVLNLLKLNDGWRSILRQKKSTEIKKDLDVLQQTFERQVDLLDSIIKNLGVNVTEAESQSAQLHRSHLQQIQTLLELQRKRMDYLEQGWESYQAFDRPFNIYNMNIFQGERTLRLAKLCKKLEEKLLITNELETPPENEMTIMSLFYQSWEYPQLKLFTAHQKSALLQREVLRRRRDAMRYENTQLHLKIQQLRQHQQNITISGQSLPQADIKKGRSNTLGQEKASPNPPPGCLLSLTGTQVPIAAGQKRMHR